MDKTQNWPKKSLAVLDPELEKAIAPIRDYRRGCDQAEGHIKASLMNQWKEKVIEDLVDVVGRLEDPELLFMLHAQINFWHAE